MLAGIILIVLAIYGLWVVNAVGVKAAWEALR